MLDIPYDEAVQKIIASSGLSEREIETKVQEKLAQLSGLISRDGAIHIIANELNVSLARAPGVSVPLKIKDITLRSRNIVVSGRVVRKYDPRSFEKNGRSGRVASLLLGDDTGLTRLVFWNDQVDVFLQLKEDDVLVVQNPFVKQSYQQDRLELQLNDQSTLTVNPEGVTVDRKSVSSERGPRVQKYVKDIAGGEENVELVATIVQVYDPRFYDACPECRRKLIGTQCSEHGEVKPDINFNLTAFLDDSTGNIRVSFWKNQALTLTGRSVDDFLRYRDDPLAFEEVKNELLGEIVKVVGSAKRNETFDRIEFTAQLVFRDVDPAQELEALEKKLAHERSAKTAQVTPSSSVVPSKPVSSDSDVVVQEDVISLDDLEEMGK